MGNIIHRTSSTRIEEKKKKKAKRRRISREEDPVDAPADIRAIANVTGSACTCEHTVVPEKSKCGKHFRRVKTHTSVVEEIDFCGFFAYLIHHASHSSSGD